MRSPINFSKLLRRPVLQNTSRRLLVEVFCKKGVLKILSKIHRESYRSESAQAQSCKPKGDSGRILYSKFQNIF